MWWSVNISYVKLKQCSLNDINHDTSNGIVMYIHSPQKYGFVKTKIFEGLIGCVILS